MVLFYEYHGVYCRKDRDLDNNVIAVVENVFNVSDAFFVSKRKCWHFFVETVAIKCINCGKLTGLYINNMNTNYNDIIPQFVLNTMLHHVGISWIIGTNKQL